MSNDSKQPMIDSLLMQPYYDAAAEKRLVLPWCNSTERYFWYPQVTSPYSSSTDWTWRDVGPQGRIFSWTVVHHPFAEELVEKVPFVVALVELDDAPGIRLLSNIPIDRAEELRIGLPVIATFAAPIWSDQILPSFEIATP